MRHWRSRSKFSIARRKKRFQMPPTFARSVRLCRIPGGLQNILTSLVVDFLRRPPARIPGDDGEQLHDLATGMLSNVRCGKRPAGHGAGEPSKQAGGSGTGGTNSPRASGTDIALASKYRVPLWTTWNEALTYAAKHADNKSGGMCSLCSSIVARAGDQRSSS
jgi:hypothetical protein